MCFVRSTFTLILVIATIQCPTVRAAIITVTDTGDGGGGTLRNAITIANNSAGEDTILFNLPDNSVIDLSFDLTITKDVRIINQKAQQVTVRAMANGIFTAGIFDIIGAKASLHGLNVVDGPKRGLRVDSQSDVRISSMFFSNNTHPTVGGAVLNEGELLVVRSTFADNAAPTHGGAISNVGTLTVLNSTIADNGVGNGFTTDFGGGIANGVNQTAQMTIRNSTLCRNHADVGGGIQNGGLGFVGTINEMTGNLLADNIDQGLGEDLLDFSNQIINATMNIVESPNGHTLDPATNQIGVEPMLGGLGDHGGTVPTKALIIDPANPAKDQGSNEQGFLYDQNGHHRTRGTGTDGGASESENRAFVGIGDWFDSNNWDDLLLAGANEPAWISGQKTADLSAGVAPPASADVDTLGVGWGGGVNAEGTLLGTGVDLNVTNELGVGVGDTDFSVHSSGTGTLNLSDVALQAGTLVVGSSMAGQEGTSATSSGHAILSNGAANIIVVTDTSVIGFALADAVGATADTEAHFEMGGTSADFQSLNIGVAFETGNIGTEATVNLADVEVNLTGHMTTTGSSVGIAIAGSGKAEVTQARMHVTAGSGESTNMTIGSAQLNSLGGSPHARIRQVDHSLTAASWTIDSRLEVGSASFSGSGVGTAQVDDVISSINVDSLTVGNLGVGSVFGASASSVAIDEVSLTLHDGVTFVNGQTAVGTVLASAGGSVQINHAILSVRSGSLTVTGSSPDLRIATATAFTPANLIDATGTIEIENADVQIDGNLQIATTELAGADESSAVNGSLVASNAEISVDGNVEAAMNLGTASIDATALFELNPSLLDIGGNLMLGSGVTLRLSIEGLTRPAPGLPGEYSAINASNVSLAGDLETVLIDPFVPDYGDSFTILTFDTRTGDFDRFIGLFLDDMMTLAPIYSATELNLIAALPGDGDLNGVVNFGDFALVANNFGSSDTEWGMGNFDLNNITNFADFVILSNNFGTDLNAQPDSVPEPATVLIVIAALRYFACRRWLHHS